MMAGVASDVVVCLQALRTAFDADKTGPERLLLTAALPAGKQSIDPGFDIGALNRYGAKPSRTGQSLNR